MNAGFYQYEIEGKRKGRPFLAGETSRSKKIKVSNVGRGTCFTRKTSGVRCEDGGERKEPSA